MDDIKDKKLITKEFKDKVKKYKRTRRRRRMTEINPEAAEMFKKRGISDVNDYVRKKNQRYKLIASDKIHPKDLSEQLLWVLEAWSRENPDEELHFTNKELFEKCQGVVEISYAHVGNVVSSSLAPLGIAKKIGQGGEGGAHVFEYNRPGPLKEEEGEEKAEEPREEAKEEPKEEATKPMHLASNGLGRRSTDLTTVQIGEGVIGYIGSLKERVAELEREAADQQQYFQERINQLSEELRRRKDTIDQQNILLAEQKNALDQFRINERTGQRTVKLEDAQAIYEHVKITNGKEEE